MSLLPPGKVKQGFWIDWSRGQVLGSTITTTTTTANVIVAVLAVFVSLASAHLWHLCLFCFYQIRAKKDSGDGLYRQQQALFRSVTSPEQTLWDFAKLGWTWRGKAQNSVLRSSAPVLVTLIFTLGALAASLASSFIVNTSIITVLVDSNNCGAIHNNPSNVVITYLNIAASSAQTYANACYLKDITSGSCIEFVQPRLNFSMASAPCPFSPSICIGSEENPAITFDTGYLDSNDDFGLNAPQEDRVQIRKKTTCAPIKVSGYYKTVEAQAINRFGGYKTFPGEQYFQLEYGTKPGFQGTPDEYFSYDSYRSNFTMEYLLRTEYSGPTYGNESVYMPIKQLQRTDADTNLAWVFPNSIQYGYKVDDPVFSAHKKSFKLLEAGGQPFNMTVYDPDNPFGAVACAEQYQFCVTNTAGLNCTDLGGLPKPPRRVALTSNENQLTTFHLFYYVMFGTDISSIPFTQIPLLTPNILQSEGLQTGYIPSNQWIREVTLWESYVLSYIQSRLAIRAIGPRILRDNGSEFQFIPPPTAAGKRLCKAQKMMVNGGFANISVFGLAFTIAISGAVVLADLLFLRIIIFLGRYNKFWGFNVESWVQDGVLQLQRKAYEGAKQGNWTRRNKEIPLVGRDDQLYGFKAEHENSEDQNAEGQQSRPMIDKIVTLDSESPRLSSTQAENQILREKDTEIAMQPVHSVATASTASRGSEAGTETTLHTNEKTKPQNLRLKT